MQLLSLRAHYLFAGAAHVAVAPFIRMIAKQNGYSASLTGFISLVVPFTAVASRTFATLIADKFQNIKNILIFGTVIHAIFQFFLVYVPALPPTNIFLETSASCIMVNNSPTVQLVKPVKLDCLPSSVVEVNRTKSVCSISCFCESFGNCHISSSFSVIEPKTEIIQVPEAESQCFQNIQYNCNVDCYLIDDRCTSKDQLVRHWKDTIRTQSFILFSFYHFMAHLAGDLSGCLGDTATYLILKSRSEDYGQQRMWASIGWGGFAPIAGYLNDLFTLDKLHYNYQPGFYLMAVLTFLHVIALKYMRIPSSTTSKDISADVRHILSNTYTLYYVACAYIMGTLFFMFASYHNWYIQELGASQSLIGLTMMVYCFVGELPVLYFSGTILRKIGFTGAVNISLLGFWIRMLAYGYITDPWFFIPFEALNGATFSMYWTAMTMYANSVALPGTEATVQGIFANLFLGLGQMTGCLITGLLYDALGGQTTFWYYAHVVAIVLCFNIIISIYFRRMKDHYKRLNFT